MKLHCQTGIRLFFPLGGESSRVLLYSLIWLGTTDAGFLAVFVEAVIRILPLLPQCKAIH